MKLRERQVEGATGDLAQAVSAREKAERAREMAENALERSDEAAERLRDAERRALEEGELRAGDLHRAEAWEMGVAAERTKLAQSVATTESAEAGARAKEEEACAALATREADAKVVEKDKERWDERVRRRELAKEEE
jgi:hypothetical protein